MPDPAGYRLGKSFSIEELRKPKRVRQPSPRDEALTRAIRAAAAAPESEVLPFYVPESEKVGTAKAAARRLIASLELPVNVGVSASHPGALLFSRGTLSNRGKRSS